MGYWVYKSIQIIIEYLTIKKKKVDLHILMNTYTNLYRMRSFLVGRVLESLLKNKKEVAN